MRASRLTWLAGSLAMLFLAVGAGLQRNAGPGPERRATPPQSAPQSAPQFVPGSRYADHIGVITIEGPIDVMTLQTLQRRLERALTDGCNGIVLELNTPGGDMQATLAISHLLKTHPTSNRVAWVRPQAFSAGTIIALTCREIVVASASSIGDAAPIAFTPGMGLQSLPVAERAKLEAPILDEVTDSAVRNGYDVRLVRAFVSVSDALWLIERDDGKRIFADAREYELVFGQPPSVLIAPRFVPDEPPAPLAERSALQDSDAPALDVISAELFEHNPRVGAEERGRWRLLGQVDTPTELVTLRGEEAYRYGLASAVVNSDEDLLGFFGATKLTRYDESWSEALVRFLIAWPVRGVLIVVVLLCFFLEWITAGTGWFGTIAVLGMVILIGAPALAGLAQWWEILLVVVGLGLIAVELFAVPGLGLVGIAGGLCLLIGLVFTFVRGDLRSAEAQNDLLIAFIGVLGSCAVAGMAIGLIMRRMHTSPFFRRFVLEQEHDETLRAAPVLLGPPLPAIGATGSALSDLRPSGSAVVGDGVFDVRTTGAWIPRGTPVRVVDRDGLGLVVEASS
ncbi:MAG: NfeD family protein [Phycisphaerae bacterium]|nr:NfeD family protein [Phycisphaerae bacterium]